MYRVQAGGWAGPPAARLERAPVPLLFRVHLCPLRPESEETQHVPGSPRVASPGGAAREVVARDV